MVTVFFDVADEEYDDIMISLYHLYSTRTGTCPMDRDFGINYDGIVGAPADIARNRLAYEIITKTEKYENRVTVNDIQFDIPEEDGQLKPVIYVSREAEEDDDE